MTHRAGLPGTEGFSVLRPEMSWENQTGWLLDMKEILPSVALLHGFLDRILFRKCTLLCERVFIGLTLGSVPGCEDLTFARPPADRCLSCLPPRLV